MGRKLVTVIIDDRHRDSRHVILGLEPFTDIYTVGTAADVSAKLSAISENTVPVVDIILCDVNMEEDRSVDSFIVDDAKEQVHVAPYFELAGLNDMARPIVGGGLSADASMAFAPYGPILALPFTRFFRSGGVIEPVSVFWNDVKLMARVDSPDGFPRARINGYVVIALNLIWAQADPTYTFAQFGDRFSRMRRAASEETLAKMYPDRFRDAVTVRRRQLFLHARGIDGLQSLSMATLNTDAEVTIVSSDEQIHTIEARSLFADYLLIHEEVALRGAAAQKEAENRLDKELREEISLLDTGLNIQLISKFCCAFIDEVEVLEIAKREFASLYGRARGRVDANDVTIPSILHSRDLPSHLSRYLLLAAQLHFWAAALRGSDGDDNSREKTKGKASLREPICAILGIGGEGDILDHKLKEFVRGGRRGLKDFVEHAKVDPMRRPFKIDVYESWKGFNILEDLPVDGKKKKMKKAPRWAWTAVDRRIARQIWAHLQQDEDNLPHGLNGDA